MSNRPQHSALLLFLALPVAAQQGVAIFHHFHRYPTGHYTTQTQGATSGLPPSPPYTETACTAVASPAHTAAAINLGNSVGAMQNCTTRIIRDEEKIAESEQTCSKGPTTQVTHTTIIVIDDRTFKQDTLSKVGAIEMSSHSNTHYDGPCTAAQLAEASHPTKPTAEECSELAAGKKEIADSLKSCEEVPAEYRAACTSRIQAGSATLNQMLAACAK